jgi:hypothetical protein
MNQIQARLLAAQKGGPCEHQPAVRKLSGYGEMGRICSVARNSQPRFDIMCMLATGLFGEPRVPDWDAAVSLCPPADTPASSPGPAGPAASGATATPAAALPAARGAAPAAATAGTAAWLRGVGPRARRVPGPSAPPRHAAAAAATALPARRSWAGLALRPSHSQASVRGEGCRGVLDLSGGGRCGLPLGSTLPAATAAPAAGAAAPAPAACAAAGGASTAANAAAGGGEGI